ncbi:hypothetical protein SESBI_07094 [Sesbania bispinosa]|nr:hypothetical protein SESBI_07094 [Sesbania bispinosa]
MRDEEKMDEVLVALEDRALHWGGYGPNEKERNVERDNPISEAGKSKSYIPRTNYGQKGSDEPKSPSGQGEEKRTPIGRKLTQVELQEHSRKGCGEGFGRRQVLILVYCGATSNFISRELVAELNLPFENTPEYTVEVGTGEKVKGRGLCKDGGTRSARCNITQDFFLFDFR